jgi:hypothetical protein
MALLAPTGAARAEGGLMEEGTTGGSEHGMAKVAAKQRIG